MTHCVFRSRKTHLASLSSTWKTTKLRTVAMWSTGLHVKRVAQWVRVPPSVSRYQVRTMLTSISITEYYQVNHYAVFWWLVPSISWIYCSNWNSWIVYYVSPVSKATRPTNATLGTWLTPIMWPSYAYHLCCEEIGVSCLKVTSHFYVDTRKMG